MNNVVNNSSASHWLLVWLMKYVPISVKDQHYDPIKEGERCRQGLVLFHGKLIARKIFHLNLNFQRKGKQHKVF